MTDRPWFVYIVKCRDGSLYTGITTNVASRVAKHNNGTAAKFTAAATKRPVELVYSREAGTLSQALRAELAIKRMTRAQKLVMIGDR